MAGVITVLMSFSAGRVQSQPTYDRNDDRYDNRYNNGYNNQSQRGFDFFPSANVYFDISFNRYWFMRGGTWASSPFLPPGIMINRNECQRVYYNGPDVWRDNNRHRDRWCRNDNNGYNRSNDWRIMMAAMEIVATIVAMTAAMEGGIVAGEEVGEDE